jgi:hypothetical protein
MHSNWHRLAAGIGVAALGLMVAPSAASAAPAPAWQKVPVPSPLVNAPHTFTSVSCPTASYCMAVGTSGAGAGGAMNEAVPVAETYDGRTWTVRHPPTVRDGTFLDGVSCLSSTDCTVVGTSQQLDEGKPDDNAPVAEHWDGQAWRVEMTVTPDGGGSFTSVACPTASTCLAVGSSPGRPYSSALTERWLAGGAGWNVVAFPRPGRRAELASVACVSYEDCVAAGADSTGAVLDTYDGRTWSADRIPVLEGGLDGVSCASATSCVAVGEDDATNEPTSLVLSGSTWSLRAFPTAVHDAAIQSDTCLTATSCTAVGFLVHPTSTTSNSSAVVEHWDGTAWAARTVDQPVDPDLLGVSCADASSCFAVGSNSDPSGHETVLAMRGDGS